MKKIIRLLQASFLLSALALMGASLAPTPAEAGRDSCDASCDGGSYNCGGYIDPVTGQFVKCTLSCT